MADDGSHGAAARDDDDGLVRVISYNVLSPELSDPASFPENTLDECDGRKRLPRVLRLLEGAAASGAVIALQEVSQTWLGAIHAFFDARGYHYTHTLYGSPFSGYMGVGMAFPRALYALETLEVCRIADTKPLPRRRPHGESRGGRGGERRGRPGRAAVRERPQSSSSAERGVGGAAGAGGGGVLVPGRPGRPGRRPWCWVASPHIFCGTPGACWTLCFCSPRTLASRRCTARAGAPRGRLVTVTVGEWVLGAVGAAGAAGAAGVTGAAGAAG